MFLAAVLNAYTQAALRPEPDKDIAPRADEKAHVVPEPAEAAA